MKNFPSIAMIAALTASCYLNEPAPVTVDGSAELIEIDNGVEVVADYDVAIFFVDGNYWWFDDGVWFWSPWYRGHWTRAPHVPPRLWGMHHPEHFAHYHPHGWIAHRGGSWIHSRPAPHGGRR